MKGSTLRSVFPIIATIVLSIACGVEPTVIPTATLISPEQVVASARPYTVFITTRFPGDSEGSGTGIMFREDGWIVTNAHVVEGAAVIKVRVPDRGDLTAQLIGASPCDDLAVIKVPGSGFAKAQFGDSNDLQLGEDVIVTGYPLGQPDLSATRGIVSKLHVTLDQLQDLVQTDASVNPGNSGGPMLNRKGEVVGIITLKVKYDQAGNPIEGTAFAISSNLANERVPELAAGNNRDWVGLNAIPLKDIDPELRGLMIIGVSNNSPAERAGLQPLDVLLTMGGLRMDSKADLCDVVRALGSGGTLSYEIVRDGQIISSEASPASASQPRTAPTTGLTAVFEDDFSDPTSGWSEHLSNASEKGYENGKYSILIKGTGLMSWSTPGLSFGDFVLEVEATQVEGPDDNQYGVLYRYVDTDNFYLFTVSGDGYYAVAKYQDDEPEMLLEWTSSPIINLGQRTNNLAVVAAGSHFGFYINGEHVADVTDQSFPEGDIGVMAGSFDEPGVLIHFDNITVRAEQGQVPVATQTPGLTAVFEDDFSDVTCQWYEISDANVEMACQQNRYRFKISGTGVTYVSLPTRPEPYADFLLQVQIEQVEGSDRSLHGVAFRYQDSKHYYLFATRDDGHYAILKNEDGFEYLVDWTPSEHINPGSEGNLLAVFVEGPLLSVFINGESVDVVHDDSYPTGGIGLAVGTFPDESGAPVIYFDNVEVWAVER